MAELHSQVLAALEKYCLPVIVHDHSEFGSLIESPMDLSEALGISLERITKSVLLQEQSGELCVLAVCPVNRKIDIKSISRHCGLGRLELAGADVLATRIGYQRRGVSPLGLPGDIAVVIEESLLAFPSVIVGGGNIGIEVELQPRDLVRGCDGRTLDITEGCRGLSGSG